MELVAARRPFLYFPLARHFEQQIHVPRRLRRHRAGRRMDYARTDPDGLADAIIEELDRKVDYRPVPTDGARRAAALLSELLQLGPHTTGGRNGYVRHRPVATDCL